MRVLITTDVVGGVWSYTAELVDALARRGHEPALVAFGGCRNRAQREWTAARPWLDCTAVSCPLEWMPEPEPGLSASVDTLRRRVSRFQPDVIHLNQFYYGAHDLGAPKLVAAHSDVVTWWRVVKDADPPDDPWFRRYRRWVRDGLLGADARVAPSAWLASRVEHAYGVARVRPVHNARTPQPFEAARRRAVRDPCAAPDPDAAAGPRPAVERSETAHVGPANRPPRIVSAGRLWDEAKGARDLIHAGRVLGGSAEIVIAGAIEDPGGGEDFPADAAGIRYAGVLDPDDLAALYASGSVYAATSRYEPFGLAPLEAALAGCALVMSDIPTFRELWDDCALFYPPGDADVLASTLGRTLEDDDLRRHLADAARRRARKDYGPDRMAREYEGVYKAISAPTLSLRTPRPPQSTKRIDRQRVSGLPTSHAE